MAIQFGSSISVISSDWTAFKATVTSKGLASLVQYTQDASTYSIFAFDGLLAYTCTVWLGTVPDGVINGGYSQAQNDADKTDFETNYKPGGNKRIARTDVFGNPVGTPIEWAAAFGLIPGCSVSRATGYTATSAASGKAIRATAYTPQGTNAQRSVNSTSANDTSAGSGARTVLITYLDTSFVLKTTTVTLNGTTAVATSVSDIAFVESIQVMTVGTQGGGNAGTIQLWTANNGTGSIWASIAASDNVTFYAHHYIPSGVSCYLLNVHGGSTVVAGSITVNRSGSPLNVNAPQVGVGGTYTYIAAGSEDHTYRVPVAVTGPDFVWLVTRPNSATASTSYGTFEYIQF